MKTTMLNFKLKQLQTPNTWSDSRSLIKCGTHFSWSYFQDMQFISLYDARCVLFFLLGSSRTLLDQQPLWSPDMSGGCLLLETELKHLDSTQIWSKSWAGNTHDELTMAVCHITAVVAGKNNNNAPPFSLDTVELNPETHRNALKTSASIFCIFDHLVCTCYMRMG